MKLPEVFVTALILEEREHTKAQAIRAMLDRLVETHLSRDLLSALTVGVLNRERLGSTGMGRGIAIPHTRHPAVPRLMGVVALARNGLEFDSVDAVPVDLLFLLLTPPDPPGTSLRVRPEAESLMRKLRNTEFLDSLRQATSEADLLRTLHEWEDR